MDVEHIYSNKTHSFILRLIAHYKSKRTPLIKPSALSQLCTRNETSSYVIKAHIIYS